MAQAEEAAKEGGKEIVLTGVNIGDFGKTTGERFIDLVKALDKVEAIKRYRISSLEPDLLSDELIEYCAQSRAFMPHFHIPLQSGSDTVLKLMHRHYDRQLFADKIHRIKELMPDAFIGVDVMVGCRGETPECFEETYEFLKGLDVTQLHVFPYSERPGTSALSIPYVVTEKDKKLRSKRLLDLSDEKTIAFYQQHVGQEAEVLFEMMGVEVCDPDHVEGDIERLPGLALLPTTTTMSGSKRTRQVEFSLTSHHSPLTTIIYNKVRA